jgi:hypothetical protein
MSISYYVCPLCGHQFKWTGKRKTAKCGDHTISVAENEGILTVQVVKPETKPHENVLEVGK